jgi:hypothetical protein
MEQAGKSRYEIPTLIALVLLAAVTYVARRANWIGALQLSAGESSILILLIAATLVWILVRTLRGKPAGRRIVFLYVAMAVVFPLTMQLTQKIQVTPEVSQLYEGLQSLPKGARVLASFDYDPGSSPELQPMAETFFKYAFDRGFKVIIIGLWPQGPQQANQALARVFADERYKAKSLKYGVDYVNMGFQSGNEFVIQRMGGEFKSMFASDFNGTPYDSLPLVRNIKNFSNIDYSFNLSAGYPGTKEWVLVGVDQFGFKMGAGNTAVQATSMYPYVRSGQLIGILGGMSGAAEFEEITGYRGKGAKFMLSQSFAHVIVVVFIVIGNMAYIMFERGRAGAKRKKA